MAWVLPEVDAAGNAIRYGFTALGAPYPIVPEAVYEMGTAAKVGIITAGTAVATAGLNAMSGWAPLMPSGSVQEQYRSPYGGSTGSLGSGTIDTRPPPGPLAGRKIPSMKNPRMPASAQHPRVPPVPPPHPDNGFGPDTPMPDTGVAAPVSVQPPFSMIPPGGITESGAYQLFPINARSVSYHTTGKREPW